MFRLLPALLILDCRDHHHALVPRRVYAESPGAEVGRLACADLKRNLEISHRHKRPLTDLHSAEFVLARRKRDDKQFVVRTYIDPETLLRGPVHELEKPELRLITAGGPIEQHRHRAAKDN